ncbi:hypothetical protein [Clostridium perfringens]|uniref:hypothetical protein n=1 Tax=Clostridium perfringens TaxID=1502 RepID=UPI001ABBC60A|nr:hypothetical protein [Clostridium perfringens]MBO3312427.1 hypothetical protein [Clostridium perfringens]
MKNIKEIMSEMTGLSKQIAVTINNEEVESDKGITPVSTPECCNPSTNTECATAIDSTVDFCCAMNFPANFEPANTGNVPRRMLYDVSSLKCIIEECCCNGCVQHDIRIVGCIPYILNARVTPSDLCYFNNDQVFISCSGTVCVDNVVCRVCTYKDAVLACESINNLLNCENITPSFEGANFYNCALEVNGYFTLPTCED